MNTISVSAMLIVGRARTTSSRYQRNVNTTTRKIIIGNARSPWSYATGTIATHPSSPSRVAVWYPARRNAS